ncbi:MAG: flagellar hook-basal body complex protein FliE [Brevinematia bacterium]
MLVNNQYDVFFNTTKQGHISDVKVNKSKNVEEGFGDMFLKLIDDVKEKEGRAKELQELAIVSPEEVNVHDVIIAEEEARISLLFVKTVLDKGISAWKDILNLR